MKPLPLDYTDKLSMHLDAIFGSGVSKVLDGRPVSFEFSRKTGRVKSFKVGENLAGTFRTDGGVAITVSGAALLIGSADFLKNCVNVLEDAVPFVSEGRSVFCKHVTSCGSNVRVGSDVAILDSSGKGVIAVGVSLLDGRCMKAYQRGVAVRIREGIKGRTEQSGTGI
ncbi:MAG: PUA domain-containing protein [Nitrososphaera sp.]